jgi:DNA-binding MarR family transcriptional regulator
MTSADDCARQVLEVVPLVVRTLRATMRRHRGANLSVPQFRSLGYISRETGASLSAVAEHVGLTLPSMSKMIDGLVARRLVDRAISTRDRRQVTLALSPLGRATLRTARARTQAHLAEVLSALSDAERATVIRAMQAIRPIFEPGGQSVIGRKLTLTRATPPRRARPVRFRPAPKPASAGVTPKAAAHR